MADVATYNEDDLTTTLDELQAFAATLAPSQRSALNAVIEMAVYGAAAAELLAETADDVEPEVEGFAIITGGRTAPPGAGSSSGGGTGGTTGPGGVNWAAPSPAGPIPIPYPTFGSILGSKFPC